MATQPALSLAVDCAAGLGISSAQGAQEGGAVAIC